MQALLTQTGVRSLLSLLSVLLFAISCFAQGSTGDGNGLTVIKMKWHENFRNPALDNDPNGEASERQANDPLSRQSGQVLDPLGTDRKPIRQVRDTQVRNTQIDLGRIDPDGTLGYVYEVSLRNDGEKDVSSVTWDYVFVNPDSGQEVGRRRFTTKASIPPGKTRTLTAHSAIPPTNTIDASKTSSKTPEHYTEKIVILSVEYSDNSKWSSSSSPQGLKT